MNYQKNIIKTITAFLPLFLISQRVHAVCPVCTVAVGAGVGLSRWLGIDDTISGLWIGGLMVSMGLWTANWLRDKKNIQNKYLDAVSVASMILLTIVPLYFAKMFSDPYNTLWGVNKLLLGMIVGSALFIGSVLTDKMLRNTNNGKVYVPYQRVILPVGYLFLSSLFMYFVTA